MLIYVTITRVEDRVSRTYQEEYDWSPGSEFNWSEGNYSCDCNRALFFRRAGNEEVGANLICGEGKYYVEIRSAEGELLYKDD